MRFPYWIVLIVILSTILVTGVDAAPVSAPAISQPAAIKVVVNGKDVYTDVAPIVVNGRTLVPVRVVAEAMGAEVKWDEARRAVVITGRSGLSGFISGAWDKAKEVFEAAATFVTDLVTK